MNLQEHTRPDKLEYYSFIWSEARLVIAALALVIGGVPPLLAFNPLPSLASTFGSLLTVAWIISGLASLYLLYRWNAGGKKVFGGTQQQDTIAFFIMIITGLNLGITGLLRVNIGMSISSNSVIFIITGIVYLVTAVYLYRRWTSAGKKL